MLCQLLNKEKMKIISSISLCMLLVCGVSMGDKAEFWVDGMHIKLLDYFILSYASISTYSCY